MLKLAAGYIYTVSSMALPELGSALRHLFLRKTLKFTLKFQHAQ